MSTKVGDGLSADVEDQRLICKCLGALEVCAVYDLVAQRFLDILNSIQRSFAISAGANRQQTVEMVPGPVRISPADENSCPTRPATLSPLTRNILYIFRQPFGGDSKVFGQDDYTLSKSFPGGWRFLAPEPSAVTVLRNSGHNEPPDPSSGHSTGRGDSRSGSPPFRTKEEYEAFFRRIS